VLVAVSPLSLMLLTWLVGGIGILLIAEATGNRRVAAAARWASSSAFVLLAVAGLAWQSAYGLLVLVSLVAVWVSPLLAHAQAGAVMAMGRGLAIAALVLLRPEPEWTALGLVVALPVCGILTHRLRPLLPASERTADLAWLWLDAFLVAMAAGAAAATDFVWLGVAAAAIFAGDIGELRDRFVVRAWENQVWGVPFRYLGHALLAMTPAWLQGAAA
jgi:hypothetical protein